MSPVETTLLPRLLAGEETAFRELIETYAGRMMVVARRILRSEQDAEDAVQDAFLSALRSLESFEGKSSLGTWLHRVATNAALMKLRARPRGREVELGDLLPEYKSGGHHVDPPKHWEDLPEDPLCRQELTDLVRVKIDELPENYRIALILRDIEGLSTAEVSIQLELTVGAAKVRIHRARQALRALLDPHLGKSNR